MLAYTPVALTLLLICMVAFLSIFIIRLKNQAVVFEQTVTNLKQQTQEQNQALQSQLHRFEQHLFKTMQEAASFEAANQLTRQAKQQQYITDAIHQQMKEIREQLNYSFKHHAGSLSEHVKSLNQEVKSNLGLLGQQMNKQLNDGLAKSTTTFTSIVERLTIIDEAQKKITELSSNVVSLQDILVDKRARGAFGEIQLNSLLKNVMPESHYRLQHTLSNGRRADCMLFLPKPTGNIVIDAKFPLENFQTLLRNDLPDAERKKHQAQFRQDIKKHISDIAERYILEHETSEGALMFIPAESIFAEIHSNYRDLIDFSYQKKVWLASPSTLMAILTTARAVLKDDATRKQVHIVQEHLGLLAKDFNRFEKRMTNLARHIDQAQHDVGDVNTSAKKISQRFKKIEQLDITEADDVTKDIDTLAIEDALDV